MTYPISPMYIRWLPVALAFLDHDHYDDVTGYTDPTESEHDFFNISIHPHLSP